MSNKSITSSVFNCISEVKGFSFAEESKKYSIKRAWCLDHPKKKRKKNRVQVSKYDEYIKGSLWITRRERYFRFHAMKCVFCDTYSRIQLHHIAYFPHKYGRENDKDLAPLCQSCHKAFHDLYGVKKNMHNEFKAFLETRVRSIL